MPHGVTSGQGTIHFSWSPVMFFSKRPCAPPSPLGGSVSMAVLFTFSELPESSEAKEVTCSHNGGYHNVLCSLTRSQFYSTLLSFSPFILSTPVLYFKNYFLFSIRYTEIY